METNVKTDKKFKKAKKHEVEADKPVVDTPETGEVTAEVAAGKGNGAPRPRKWDYGIIPDAQIIRLKDEASVKKDIAEAWAATHDNPTVADYMKDFASSTDARHGLRVLSRRELIKIVHPDGSEFPRQYIKPEPTPAEGEAVAE